MMLVDTVTTTGVIEILAEKGTLGVVVIILLFVIRQLDQRNAAKDLEIRAERDARLKDNEEAAVRLKAERDARLDDAKAYRDSMIEANERFHDFTGDMSRIAEQMERKERR